MERKLFEVLDEREQVPGIGMFASLHTTAYDIQAWQYEGGAISVEMHFAAGTLGSDDGALEFAPCTDREHAMKVLRAWGDEIKALEAEHLSA